MGTATNPSDKNSSIASACLEINVASVLFSLGLVNKAKQHLKKPLQKANLTLTQWLVLKIIYLNRADTPTNVSKVIDADPTTITRHLDSLEKRDLISRIHDASDRRVVQLSITEKGNDVAKQIYNSYSGIFDNIERYMTKNELLVWKKIEKCVREHVAESIS